MKKLTAILMAILLALTSAAGYAFAEAEPEGDALFEEWNPDAPALNALIEYVEAVTDPDSPDFIPEMDRIAVFDMDGTLMAELCPTYLEYYLLARRILTDPDYQPDAEMLEFGRMLRDHALDKSFPDGMDMLHATHAAKAYAGMTLDEFNDFVTRQLVRDVDGFEGMTYGECFYLPMVEVVEYLQENGFTCYVCSGSDRFICRVFIEGMLDIPYNNIIGMDVQLESTEQGDEAGLNHTFSVGEDVVRTDKLLIKNLKTNKVLQIAQEIGQQPVLSFGNSGGDTSMHNYVIGNNAYRSMAFMLIADDDVRDYGNPAKHDELTEKWQGMGYNVISMRDDWNTIYGEDVVKTGEFHWLEELAEDRVPVDAEAEAEEESDSGVQYVMYLGTNDKDTNKPVFTQAEALEQAKEILIRNFGGYTIQEAHGGWIDGDTEYQEYTLVIYLSDTNEEAVHAAADELIETFHQSSVLIQANPTSTEFYSGSNAFAESDAATGFSYEHDPRDNPNAMKDIVVNPDAVYGFSPSPDSTRLKDYVDAIDWTDPDQVAEARAQRQAYHDSLSELYRMIEDMLLEGKDVETIARAVSQRRNELRLEASADDPEGLERTKKSNLETYGDENGPSADFMYEKYGSWQTVLEKALGTNPGMDACLGFYDEYYDLYDIEVDNATVEAAH